MDFKNVLSPLNVLGDSDIPITEVNIGIVGRDQDRIVLGRSGLLWWRNRNRKQEEQGKEQGTEQGIQANRRVLMVSVVKS